VRKKTAETKNSEKATKLGHRYTVKSVIAEDQRKYIEEVREWLHDSLRGKGKIVGGPI
jgi:hypothetical protein